MPSTMRFGYTVADLTSLGFTNPPESPTGMWAFKSTSKGDVWPGYSSSVIPLIGSYSAVMNQSHGNRGSYSGSSGENGTTFAYVSGYWDGDNYASTRYSDNYNASLLNAYHLDLTALQNGHKSGTPAVWLQAV